MTTPLRDRHCQPLPASTPPLAAEKAVALLGELTSHAWRISEDGKSLRRAFKFKDFYRTMSFVNALAHVANIEDHHPDLEVGYGYCRVQFSTHAIKGLSENDFICAAKVDLIPLT